MDTSQFGIADDRIDTRKVVEVLGDGTSSGQHGSATMLDLRLLEILGLRNSGKAEVIEADVAFENSNKCMYRLIVIMLNDSK